ncbi:acidic mammalian chitinase-like [Lingula anatina]|uniref:Acidic mammalian chitinase-like n=1 Tax=Lingula anatina TaxID=7574 RepID=A0A1S3JFQ7_LINAN|nr:acidic mammalian chitinase-like [Lingula anatina]|eukprot:XP_013409193.1 acidic mammalian chitinase-like [Lingula anatina]
MSWTPFASLLALLICMVQSPQAAAGYHVVCYYTNWSQYRPGLGRFRPNHIDPNLCTHVIFAFARADNKRLAPYEYNDNVLYKELEALKRQNPRLKTLLAIGGWNAGVLPFTQIVRSPQSRRAFITQAIQYLRNNKFDGLDIDWEYPGSRGSLPKDKILYTVWLRELKAAFEREARQVRRPRLLLTAAVAGGQSYIDAGYQVAEIAKYLDMINVMSYDYHGGSFEWGRTGHHSPLYDSGTLHQDWSIRYWLRNGVPSHKLLMGVGFYGRTFRLKSAQNHVVGAPGGGPAEGGPYTREPGFWAYYEICSKIKDCGFQEEWSSRHGVPYAHRDTQWVGYDNPKSIAAKAAYIRKLRLGGAMVWSLALDDFTGSFCGQGKYPLLTTLNQGLAGARTVQSLARQRPMPRKGNTNKCTMVSYGEATSGQQSPPASGDNAAAPPVEAKECPAGVYCHEPEGLYPHPERCNQFCHCWKGIPYEKSCPGVLNYNAAVGTCDWPLKVNCRVQLRKAKEDAKKAPVRIRRTTLPAPVRVRQTTPAVKLALPEFNPNLRPRKFVKGRNCGSVKCNPDGFGLFPHPGSCDKFCQCSHFIPYEQDCPPVLILLNASSLLTHAQQDPCVFSNHYRLQDEERNYNTTARSSGTVICDRGRADAWYRFLGNAGERMADETGKSFPARSCSTESPIFLEGKHPTAATMSPGQVVTKHAAFKYFGVTYYHPLSTLSVDIKNCVDNGHQYFIYKLPVVPTCNMAYCGEGQGPTPCKVDEIPFSVNGQRICVGDRPDFKTVSISAPVVDGADFFFHCEIDWKPIPGLETNAKFEVVIDYVEYVDIHVS